MSVYFAQVCTGAPIKIGFSEDPAARMKSVTCPLMRRPPRVIATTPGSRGEEFALHCRFEAYRLPFSAAGNASSGSSGKPAEWFWPAPELLAFIAEVCDGGPASIDIGHPPTEGVRLLRLLIANGCTQDQIARGIDATQSAVSRWLRGSRPTYAKRVALRAFARLHGVAFELDAWEQTVDRPSAA